MKTGDVLRVCLFELGQEAFAIESGAVRQVLNVPAPIALPSSGSGLQGLFAYQGRVIPLLNLHPLLVQPPSTGTLSVIVQSGGEQWAFGLDSVLDFTGVILGGVSDRPYSKYEIEHGGTKARLLDIRAIMNAFSQDLAA